MTLLAKCKSLEIRSSPSNYKRRKVVRMTLSMGKLLSCRADREGEARRGAKMAAVTSLHSKTERKKVKNEQKSPPLHQCHDMHRSLLHTHTQHSSKFTPRNHFEYISRIFERTKKSLQKVQRQGTYNPKSVNYALNQLFILGNYKRRSYTLLHDNSLTKLKL